MEKDIWEFGFSKNARMNPDFTLYDYWTAPCNDTFLRYQWEDKPHRLLYDLVGEIRHLQEEIRVLENNTKMTGFWASLTDEQKQLWLNCRDPNL